MTMNKNTPNDIDNYIAGFPMETQEILQQLRLVIRNTAPNAQESINYGIPTFKLQGNLVHFGGYKNHIGFYPAPSGIEKFKKELSVYQGAKGSVQFPLNKPLPLALVKKIVQFRVKENLEKGAFKATEKKPLKPLKKSDGEQVREFIQQLEAGPGKIIDTIRQIILNTDKEIGERIKWNNPAFYYLGEMKPFNPKEYKRDIAVFNLYKGRIMLVFPDGAKLHNPAGLLEGDYKDGRRTAGFKDLKDVTYKKNALQQVIKEWIRMIDK